MSYVDLAEKYINDHNNPTTKTEQFGLKLFASPLNQEQEQLKEKCLNGIKFVLRCDRVERRLARAVAEWLPQENVAKVTKLTGALANFGFQNKRGKFLKAKEALFLLETNKIELRQNNVPLSIQEGFKIIKNFENYLTYKKLALQGYKLKLTKTDEKHRNEVIKHKLDNDEGPATKVPRVTNEREKNSLEHIFEKLRQKGPQGFQPKDNAQDKSPDYYVTPPLEKSELQLFIKNGREFTSDDQTNLNVTALCSDDDVSFYKFYKTSIPIL